ncbi:hypothetical protein [Streptomyces lavenduligriseus]|uniref:PPM-type phosphatase domain-containing protein n=1 Tax=Streptomyces lavenduligriseus TaxID=67315 RepID=A0ABT0P7B2_9ACTN|nr:hypothetical protein [Streptomyces lavenduligriseus]MCL3998788.1 hypothetical protein [Streptomyces lavenduligriseus]
MREDIDEDLAVRSYATAQRRGDRALQCDATAVCTAPDGTRAYALLDGVGDTPAVRSWTRTAALRLVRAAAGHADAEAGLRAEYGHYAADPARTAGHDLPCAAAVVAVHVPGGLFSVAWSGDARAYLLLDGHLRLLTEDHNARSLPASGKPAATRRQIRSGATRPSSTCAVWPGRAGCCRLRRRL